MKVQRFLPPLVLVLFVATTGLAETAEPWLHVRVDSAGEKAEKVRVNVPLALAEAVLPAVHVKQLQAGKLKLREIRVREVDLFAVLQALRTLPDGQFVSVDSDDQSVRVTKAGGYFYVNVQEHRQEGPAQQVDVKLPVTVVEALLSGAQDELDVLAGVRALRAHGDIELVTVKDGPETVRVWIDAKSTME